MRAGISKPKHSRPPSWIMNATITHSITHDSHPTPYMSLYFIVVPYTSTSASRGEEENSQLEGEFRLLAHSRAQQIRMKIKRWIFQNRKTRKFESDWKNHILHLRDRVTPLKPNKQRLVNISLTCGAGFDVTIFVEIMRIAWLRELGYLRWYNATFVNSIEVNVRVKRLHFDIFGIF